jgi:predicted  nucleic acid-binding Zn-ribbon protein
MKDKNFNLFTEKTKYKQKLEKIKSTIDVHKQNAINAQFTLKKYKKTVVACKTFLQF